ncbi:MAG: histidine ammonia-lyase [Candidatus Eremiobacteraeota bacterium]|nr:histidine ammonia-lyase [Candidatus Eremiobacteraeota bacterium]
MSVELDGRRLALETVEQVAIGRAPVEVGVQARERVAAACACVERHFAAGDVIYGVTTGFGRMANVVIAPEDAFELQRNLVLSHAAGTGAPLREEQVRAAALLQISALAAGHSGVRPSTLDLLLALLNRGVTPVVPSQGSVGASGDLAPLAHMTLTLMGEGEATFEDERLPSRVALERAGLAPIVLGAKEGLSLINGTEVMTGIAILSLLRAERLLAVGDVIGAMSLEAFLGTDAVFDRRINALRPHPGQAQVADNLRSLLDDSEIMRSHRDCGRVQDPYSFRCISVVHGAARDAAAHARSVLEIEAISVTDNPLVFPEDDEFLTGGNFHGQPVGLVCDFLKAAMVELASISERRCYLLLNGEERGLPLFLSRRPGLDSGLMIAQYTAAALVSESKALAFPSSVDSIPTSAGQEDHVSMGTIAARTLDAILDNVEGALACELLCALAATDFRRPLRSGRGTQAAYDAARAFVAPLERPRALGPDVAAAPAAIGRGAVATAAEAVRGMNLVRPLFVEGRRA